jgi:hypothetical protein
MRIVLDTNVTVSALLWRGTPYRLVETIRRQRQDHLFTSPALLEASVAWVTPLALPIGSMRSNILENCFNCIGLMSGYCRSNWVCL